MLPALTPQVLLPIVALAVLVFVLVTLAVVVFLARRHRRARLRAERLGAPTVGDAARVAGFAAPVPLPPAPDGPTVPVGAAPVGGVPAGDGPTQPETSAQEETVSHAEREYPDPAWAASQWWQAPIPPPEDAEATDPDIAAPRPERAAVAPDPEPAIVTVEPESAPEPVTVEPESAPEPVTAESDADQVVADPEPPVAAAVADTLARRAAHRRVAQQESVDGRPTDPRGDDRDRLLAVLLVDPVRAVGATVELQARLRRLRSLTDDAQHEREAVGEALRRLSAAGLSPEQITRVSGLAEDELTRLLAHDGLQRVGLPDGERPDRERSADGARREGLPTW